jgi:hypothetical protein
VLRRYTLLKSNRHARTSAVLVELANIHESEDAIRMAVDTEPSSAKDPPQITLQIPLLAISSLLDRIDTDFVRPLGYDKSSQGT